MNDERYILARLKAQMLQMLKGKNEFDYRHNLIHEMLDLITAIEVTAVLDMEVDDLVGREEGAE